MARAPLEIEADPQSDVIEGLAHPRECERLVGHQTAIDTFVQAHQSGRLHHAWILGGPKGVGKASFAYLATRYMLSGDAVAAPGLAVPQGDPIAMRLRSGAHGNVRVVRKSWDQKTKKFKTGIGVENIRTLTPFFGSTSSEAGYRIAIIDAADDMNVNAANALLKMLEEPPARSLFFLISHAPGRLLPTIRSRCRKLTFTPLPEAQVEELIRTVLPETSPTQAHAVARLADGAPGRAMALVLADGFTLYEGLFEAIGAGGAARNKFADPLVRAGQDEQFSLFCDLLTDWLSRIAREAVKGASVEEIAIIPAETHFITKLLQRAGPQGIDQLRTEILRDKAQTMGLNLDKRQFVLRCLTALAVGL